jgi:hypothetical protein
MLPIGLALKLDFHPLTQESFGQYCYYSTKTATSSLVAIEDSGNLQYHCWIMLHICIGDNLKYFLLLVLL